MVKSAFPGSLLELKRERIMATIRLSALIDFFCRSASPYFKGGHIFIHNRVCGNYSSFSNVNSFQNGDIAPDPNAIVNGYWVGFIGLLIDR